MITIYKTFCQAFGYPIDDLKDIGYTKLYLIRDVSETKELADHWIGEARVLNRDDLKKRVLEFTKGVDQMTCEHPDTYLVRCCRACGEKWEEYPDTTK